MVMRALECDVIFERPNANFVLDDIVMTADVDALIASQDLLAPLSQTETNAWIFQVSNSTIRLRLKRKARLFST